MPELLTPTETKCNCGNTLYQFKRLITCEVCGYYEIREAGVMEVNLGKNGQRFLIDETEINADKLKKANEIIDYVMSKLKIDKELALKGKNLMEFSPALCICIHEIKANTYLKHIQIAKIFNYRDHTMISYRLLLYDNLLFSSHEFKRMARIAKYTN